MFVFAKAITGLSFFKEALYLQPSFELFLSFLFKLGLDFGNLLKRVIEWRNVCLGKIQE